ncbi:MAG: hypothetical protein NUV53_02410 [Patescibacteria group bacterium]|nr:hypothetical protein [Patescibacteria group bacterium]
MKIICDEETATYTLVPIETGEAEDIIAVVEVLKPGDSIKHISWMCVNNVTGSEKSLWVLFQNPCGGSFNEVSLELCSLNSNSIGTVITDGKKITTATFNNEEVFREAFSKLRQQGRIIFLCGSTRDDEKVLDDLNNTARYGGRKLVFLGETDFEGKRAVVVTGGIRCKQCGDAMLDYSYKLSPNEAVCDECASKCCHQYSAVLSRDRVSADFFRMYPFVFCSLCARPRVIERRELRCRYYMRKYDPRDHAFMLGRMKNHL